MRLFASLRRLSRKPGPAEADAAPRVLFLDDDPERARVFLEQNPQALWVQTAAECIARLEEAWDEVHLDHDLGGEQFVEHDRDDCGMEVVRWLCRSRRPHLAAARFYVHSHNAPAAALMGMQLSAAGFAAELRPFGSPPLPPPLPDVEPPPARSRLWRRLVRAWCLVRRRPVPPGYSDADTDARPADPEETAAWVLDLSWAKAAYVRHPARPEVPPSEPPDYGWTQDEFLRDPGASAQPPPSQAEDRPGTS
jgi:hypothetical protein